MSKCLPQLDLKVRESGIKMHHSRPGHKVRPLLVRSGIHIIIN